MDQTDRRRVRTLAVNACLLSSLLLPALALAAAPAKAPPASRALPAVTVEPRLFSALTWREVGPYRGGRSAAVTGVPGDRNTYWFGSTGGGVWKTGDGGRTWKSASDGFFGGSIGAVAVSEWDPNVVYVGGGEKTVRGNVSHGDGVWKSTDAGKTWTFAGLADSRHVPRLRIHPKNPDLVYAAVLGHLFGPNTTRGVYRSKDGGKSWERVLYVNPNVGAVDLAMDPTNPRILYATLWNVRRTPYSLESGGPGSGLFKSTDGGDTWADLSKTPGFPEGTLGILGVTVSPSNPDNVYAIVEAEKGGVFRSKDGGKSWTKTNDDRSLRQRAWYYTRIYADPKDEEVVYVLNVQFHRSKDGGRTFTRIRTPHGDNHDLWIDPQDPLRMIESNDGGANVSTDGGRTWTPQSNQPTAQIYRVSTDNHFPYRILGAQQDNSALRILSRGSGAGIGANDWQPTSGGESGHIVADPRDPDVVYGGSYGGFLTRVNHRTGEVRDINVWPDDPMGWGAAELEYRFQWNFPLLFSPHDPGTLYAAGNVLFESTDEGQSWREISPDLTRNDKTKQGPSGGPITKDNTSVEYYGTIFAVAESPLLAGVLWAGSDDGLLHVSKDGGKSWSNVTPKALPEWSMVNAIDASPHEPGGAYVATTLYKSDDFRPYLWKTSDYGQSWTRIDQGIDAGHFTRVVRADPVRRGLLYAGTERGAYVSFDDGGNWQTLQLNLPVVPVTDLTVKDGDLVAATQGRGFWVLDDPTPLREVAAAPSTSAAIAAKAAHFFAPRPAVRLTGGVFGGGGGFMPGGVGQNPPTGAVFHYYLKAAPPKEEAENVQLEILTADGQPIRTFKGKPAEGTKEEREPKARDRKEEVKKEAEPAAQEPRDKDKGGEADKEEAEDKESKEEEEEKIPTEVGLNRFVWDLTWPKGKSFPGMILWSGEPFGPVAVPGTYQARLTVGEEKLTVPFEVVKDPRSSATQADLEAQVAFLLAVRDKLSETHDAIRRIREMRGRLGDLRQRAKGQEEAKELLAAVQALEAKMKGVEEALYQTKNKSQQDPLNFPVRLNDKLNALAGSVAIGDYRPTAQAVAVKDRLVAAIDAELAKLREAWEGDLVKINELAQAAGLAAAAVPESRIK